MAKKDYVYAVARIRVLEKGLLSDAFIEQLITAADAQAVRRLLQEKGWEEDLGREEERIRKTMEDLGADPEIFEILNLPDRFHNLKAGIKDAASRESHPSAYYEGVSPDQDTVRKIVEEKNWTALPDYMQKPAEEVYEYFVNTLDGQLCDVMIDKACLDAVRAYGKASRVQVIKDYAEAAVASADIKIAARCAMTGKKEAFIEKAVAECDTLDAKRLTEAASSGLGSLMSYLELTPHKDAAAALKASFSEFERWCDNMSIEAIRPQKANPFSAGPLFAYMVGRKNEIKTVRVILTGKENGLSNDAIRERVRRMYG